MATTQAKQAIAKLKDYGFERSEFSVRTDREVFSVKQFNFDTKTWYKQKCVEYGRAIITIWASKEKQLGHLSNLPTPMHYRARRHRFLFIQNQ